MPFTVITPNRVVLTSVLLTGSPLHTWRFSAQLRAVCGSNQYDAPGEPTYPSLDALLLTVSDNGTGLPEVHGLNAYPGGSYITHNYAIDKIIEFEAKGNATLTLSLDNQDHFQYQGDVNGDPIEVVPLAVVEGIWAQLDFISAVLI